MASWRHFRWILTTFPLRALRCCYCYVALIYHQLLRNWREQFGTGKATAYESLAWVWTLIMELLWSSHGPAAGRMSRVFGVSFFPTFFRLHGRFWVAVSVGLVQRDEYDMLRWAGPYFSGHLAVLMHGSLFFRTVMTDYRLRLYCSSINGLSCHPSGGWLQQLIPSFLFY